MRVFAPRGAAEQHGRCFNMNIALCDDNQLELKHVRQAIAARMVALGMTCRISAFSDAAELLHVQNQQPFDAVFLDIDMPRIDGMQTAEHIGLSGSNSEIIFVTNHDELVYKAYRFKALGFIRKQLLDSELDELLPHLIRAFHRRERYLTYQDAGSIRRIRLQEVLYLQSDDHYVQVTTRSGREVLRESLNAIEAAHPDAGLIRIHMRYLVNFQHIYSIENNTVVLCDRTQLPMSRNRVARVKEQFQIYMRRF